MKDDAAGNSAPAEATSACRNCGTALVGEYCHACGQGRRGEIRHLPAVVRDFLDTVFEYDGRLWRTLGPLIWRPGHLSLEYFRGRRVRYVNPFRLFFFLTVLAFFAAQLRFDINLGAEPEVRPDVVARIEQAQTPEEVERVRGEAVASLDSALALAQVGGPAVLARVESARASVEAAAQRRLEALGGDVAAAPADEAEPAPPPPAPPPPAPLRPDLFNIGGRAWDPVLNPVRIAWLPEGLNARLNEWIGRVDINQRRIRENPNLLKDAFLSSIPATLFVVVPIFALFLKIAYLFQRRLYMEHLIVAFHSHAFLSATILLLITLSWIQSWTTTAAVSRPIGVAETALVVWLPLYVLVLQKRVYGQGWPMTLVKYVVLGFIYLVLLTFAVVINLLFNLVAM